MSKIEDAKQPSAAEKMAQDLHAGLDARDLSKSIEEISDARTSMSPKDYSQLLTDFNKAIDDQEILRRTSVDIVGVDESGKNLIIEDRVSGTGAVINADGKTIKPLSSEELLRMHNQTEQHLIGKNDAKSKDDVFSVFMPPGLDTKGSGRSAVNSHDRRTTYDPVTDTYKTEVSGDLKDSDWGLNIHGYVSADKTKYSGSVVTDADGKILESHIEYDTKLNTTVLGGGVGADFPHPKFGPRFAAKELGRDLQNPSSIDVKYNKLTDSYFVSIDGGRGSFYELKNGKAKSLDPKHGSTNAWDYYRDQQDYYSMSSGKGKPNGTTFDKFGYASDLQTEFANKKYNASIERNDSHDIETVTDSLNGTWTRKGDKEWQYELNGTVIDKHGDLFVDGNQNIVLKGENGCEITSIEGNRFTTDRNGLVTSKHTNPSWSDVKTDYVYNDQQKLVKTIVNEPDNQYTPDKWKSERHTTIREFEGAKPLRFQIEL